MKKIKKFASLILAMVMVLSMALTVNAADYSITVTNEKDSISIVGKTYSAYKLFDVSYNADKTAYSYTIADDFKDFTYTDTDENSYSGEKLVAYVGTLTNDSEALNAVAKAALNYAETNSIEAAGSATAASETVVIDLSEAGYYLVAGTATAEKDQTITAACALTTTNPTAEVKVKADAPKIEKKINLDAVEDSETSGKVDYNNTAIGKKVPYEITSNVPDMIGYVKYYFVVNDTLSKGLTYNNDLEVTLGGNTLTEGTDYTLTKTDNADGTTSLKIVFINFIQYKNQAGAEIVISYTATVNKDAVIGTAGNPNKVNLTYSNNPNTDEGGNPTDEPTPNSPTGVTPDDWTYTYVTDLEVIKTDEEGKALAGAVFTLEGTKLSTVLITKEVFEEDENGTYWKLTDGTYSTDDPNAEGMGQSKYESTTVKYSKKTVTEEKVVEEAVTSEVEVGADGRLYFAGLAAGTYTITEIKAPDGYNLLDEPITVTITWTAPAEGSTNCTWTYEGTDKENEVATNHVTVVNKTGTELPSTGGIGTTVFYVIGGALVLFAAVLLVVKRRMRAE